MNVESNIELPFGIPGSVLSAQLNDVIYGAVHYANKPGCFRARFVRVEVHGWTFVEKNG